MFGNKRRKAKVKAKAKARGVKISDVMDRHYESEDKNCKPEVKTGREIIAASTENYEIHSLLKNNIQQYDESWIKYVILKINEELERVQVEWQSNPKSFEPKRIESTQEKMSCMDRSDGNLLDIALATSTSEEEYEKKVSLIYKKRHQKKQDEKFTEEINRYRVFQKYGEIYFTTILPQIRDILQE